MKSSLILIPLAFGLQGCMFIRSGPTLVGSGKMKTESRPATGFTAINLGTSADVNVIVGEGPSVEITGDDNYLSSVLTDVDGTTLNITNKNGSYTNVTLRVAIKVPTLEGVKVNGSGDIRIQGLRGDSFSAEISGSGDVHATGTVREVNGKINGSGDIKLSEVKAESGSANINGSGDIAIHAAKKAVAKINGSGTIRVSGGGEVQSKVNGSGEVLKV